MADRIESAYRTSKGFYDMVLTQGNVFSRLYFRVFWGGVDDVEIARSVLSHVPDDFSGDLLDVPVGTAVFTQDRWLLLEDARIVCLDYSRDMLEQAKVRLGSGRHISFVQGDVGDLPMGDGSFDVVVSMNGFHVFPDKERAFDETWRVLRPGGMFVACFYIKGKSRRADWLARNILSRKGWFTPPFQTEEELREKLAGMYREVEIDVVGSMVSFRCLK